MTGSRFVRMRAETGIVETLHSLIVESMRQKAGVVEI